MNYGVANKLGKPDRNLARKIVKTAWEKGMRLFDTAQAYGESEEALGRAVRSLGLGSEIQTITKLDPTMNHLDKSELELSVKASIVCLNVPNLYGLMLHKEEHLLLWEHGLSNILGNFVAKGLTERIGVSVYSPEMALYALEKDGIDMVQVPSNIFDRRFEKAGVFKVAKEMGKQVYVRSIFLQGLALLNPKALPQNMSFALPIIERIDALSIDMGLTRQELAIGYARNAYSEERILLGAETPEQVDENIVLWKRSYPTDLVELVRKAFGDVEEKVLNPALWPHR